MSIKQFSMEVAGKELKVEVGKFAKQAHGACTVTYGDTVVLATAVTSGQPREGVDYFPLMVDYEERLYAAGKIKGSRFIKREGRATDEAILTARLIDRSIRPLFKESARDDIQVVITVLSYDGINDPDFPAVIGASVALGISPIVWAGPLAGVQVGRIGGEWVLNSTVEAKQKSDLDLFVAGSADEAIMIEAGAKQISEQDMYEAIEFAGKHIRKIVAFVDDIIKKVGSPKREPVTDGEKEATRAQVKEKVHQFLAKKDLANVFDPDKSKMKAAIESMKAELDLMLKEDNEVSKDMRAIGVSMIEEALEKAFKSLVLEQGKRPDNRKFDEIRELSAEVALLPRTHGSGLFSRGETQVLSIVTLGAPGDEQTLDTMEESGTKKYMHHYNFPGYCVGEVKPLRGPGRREIGHGALAEKALVPVLPDSTQFPYTIRVVSEVMGSNGSSSQASICGSTLSLMDAGVPIVAPVAGIAMGLVLDDDNKDNYRILTDIQGIEDHSGHMDFKVAGTRDGITAIQLDIKLGGISYKIVKETLVLAKEARIKVLDVMKQAIAEPRADLSPYAPRITSLQIDPDKIRDVIGTGGKIINEIIDKCGVSIDIEQTGLVMITSTDEEGAKKAKAWIENIVKEIEIGEIYEGKVIQIVKGKDNGSELGAIVELLPGKDGMVHISQVSHERIAKITDVINIGDTVKVKVMEVDKERNRISLSIKELLPRPAFAEKSDRPYSRDRNDRNDKKSNFFRKNN
ncbi:polyribonucleotide nucleotidyltransferase [Candidatus Parcubacteria bacterium]|nr:MAG: polyribonucleotide nucleotidyltransferase [Candidatus Parcubacteria bacterium]